MKRAHCTALIATIPIVFFLIPVPSLAKVQCNVNGAIVTRDTIEECQTQNQEKVDSAKATSSGGAAGSGGGSSGGSKNEPTVDKKDSQDVKNCDEATVEKLPGVSVTCSKPGIIGGQSGQCTARYLSCEELKKPADEAIQNGGTSPGAVNPADTRSPSQNLFQNTTAADAQQPGNEGFNNAYVDREGFTPQQTNTPGTSLSDSSQTLDQIGRDFIPTNAGNIPAQSPFESFGSTLSDIFTNPSSWGNAFNNAFSGLGAGNTLWGGGISPSGSFNTTPFAPSFSGGNTPYTLSGSTFGSAPSAVSNSGFGSGYQSFQNISAPTFSSLSLSNVPSQLYNSLSPALGVDAAGNPTYTLLNNTNPFAASGELNLARLNDFQGAPYSITDTAFNGIPTPQSFDSGAALRALADPGAVSITPLNELTQNSLGAIGDAAQGVPGVSVSNLSGEQLARAVPTFNDVLRQVEQGNFQQAARLLGQNAATTISNSAARYGSALREFFRLPGTVFSTAPNVLGDLASRGASLGFDANGLPTIATQVTGPGSLLDSLTRYGDARPALQNARDQMDTLIAQRETLEQQRSALSAIDPNRSINKPLPVVSNIEDLNRVLTSGEGGPERWVTREQALSEIQRDRNVLETTLRNIESSPASARFTDGNQSTISRAEASQRIQNAIAGLDQYADSVRSAPEQRQFTLANGESLSYEQYAQRIDSAIAEYDRSQRALGNYTQNLERIVGSEQLVESAIANRNAQEYVTPYVESEVGVQRRAVDIARANAQLAEATLESVRAQTALSDIGVPDSVGASPLEDAQRAYDQAASVLESSERRLRMVESMSRYLSEGMYAEQVASLQLAELSGQLQGTDFPRLRALEDSIYGMYNPHEAVSEQGLSLSRAATSISSLFIGDVAYDGYIQNQRENIALLTGNYLDIPYTPSLLDSTLGTSPLERSIRMEMALAQAVNPQNNALLQRVNENNTYLAQETWTTPRGIATGVYTAIETGFLTNFANTYGAPLPGTVLEDARLGYSPLGSWLVSAPQTALDLGTIAQVSTAPFRFASNMLRAVPGSISGYGFTLSDDVVARSFSFVDNMPIQSLNNLVPNEVVGFTNSFSGVTDDIARLAPSGAGGGLFSGTIPATSLNGGRIETVAGIADDVARLVPSGAGTGIVLDQIPVTSVNGVVVGPVSTVGSGPLSVTGIANRATVGSSAPRVTQINQSVLDTLPSQVRTQAAGSVSDYERIVGGLRTASDPLDIRSLNAQQANVIDRLANVGLEPTGVGSAVRPRAGGAVPITVRNPGSSLDEVLTRGVDAIAPTASTPDVSGYYLRQFLAQPFDTAPAAVTPTLARTTVPLGGFQSLAQSPVGRAIQSLNALSVGMGGAPASALADAVRTATPAIIRQAVDITPSLPSGVAIRTSSGVTRSVADAVAEYSSFRSALATPSPIQVLREGSSLNTVVTQAVSRPLLSVGELANSAARAVPIQTLKNIPLGIADEIPVRTIEVTPVSGTSLDDVTQAALQGDMRAAEQMVQGAIPLDEFRNTLAPQLPDGSRVSLGQAIGDVVNAINPFYVAPANAGEVKVGIASTYRPGGGGIEGGLKGAFTNINVLGTNQVARLSSDLQPFDVVRICNGDSCIVRYVGDKGYFPGRNIDLQQADAARIGCPTNGLCTITYEVVARPDSALVRQATVPALTNQSGLLKIQARTEATQVAEQFVREWSERAVQITSGESVSRGIAAGNVTQNNPAVASYITEQARVVTESPEAVAAATAVQAARVEVGKVTEALKALDVQGAAATRARDLDAGIRVAEQVPAQVQKLADAVQTAVTKGDMPAEEIKAVEGAIQEAKQASAQMVRELKSFEELGLFQKMGRVGELERVTKSLKSQLDTAVKTLIEVPNEIAIKTPGAASVLTPNPAPLVATPAAPVVNPLMQAAHDVTQVISKAAESKRVEPLRTLVRSVQGAASPGQEFVKLAKSGGEIQIPGIAGKTIYFPDQTAVRDGAVVVVREGSAFKDVVPRRSFVVNHDQYGRNPIWRAEKYHNGEIRDGTRYWVAENGDVIVARRDGAIEGHVGRTSPADISSGNRLGYVENWNAVGIEFEGYGYLTPAQIQTGIALNAFLQARHDIPASAVLAHLKQFPNKVQEGAQITQIVRGVNFDPLNPDSAISKVFAGVTGGVESLLRQASGVVRSLPARVADATPFISKRVRSDESLQLASAGVPTTRSTAQAGTYPHWGNEGGVQSGEITQEILKRLPVGAEVSVPYTYGTAKIKEILDSCSGCTVKFYIESNPLEVNDAAAGIPIHNRIQETARVRDELSAAGYKDRVVNSVEMDAARDYFTAGDSATPVLHAQWLKAAGFDFYEPKGLTAEQIARISDQSGLTVRSAIFEDPKSPDYLPAIKESISSGRATTVSFKETSTPGYGGDTRGEAEQFAKEYAQHTNLTVVYSPKGGIPEIVKFGDGGSQRVIAQYTALPKPTVDTAGTRIKLPSGEQVQATYRTGIESWNIGIDELRSLTPEARTHVAFTRADGSRMSYGDFVTHVQQNAEVARAQKTLAARITATLKERLGSAVEQVRYIGTRAGAIVSQIAPNRFAVVRKMTPEHAAAETALAAAKKQGVFSEQAFVRVENANVYIVDPAKPNERFVANATIQNTAVSRGEPGRFATAQPLQTEAEMKAVAATLNKILPDSLGYITQPIAVKNAAGETVIITPKNTAEVNTLLRQNGMHELQPIYTNKTWGDRYSGQVSAGLRATQEALLSQKARIESGELSGLELVRFYRSIGLVGLQNTLRPDIVRAKVLTEKILGTEFYTIAATETGHQTHLRGDHFDAYFGPIDQSLREKISNLYGTTAMNTKTAAAAAWVRAARETNLSGVPCVGTYGAAGMHFGSCSGKRGWDLGGNGGGAAIAAYRANPSAGVGGFSFEEVVTVRNQSYYTQTNRMTPQENIVSISRELTDMQRRALIPVTPEEVFRFALTNEAPAYRISEVIWDGTGTLPNNTASLDGAVTTTGGGAGGAGGAGATGGGALPPTDAQILEALAQGTLPPGSRIGAVALTTAAGVGGLALLTGNEQQDLATIQEELNRTQGPLRIDPNTLEVYTEERVPNPAYQGGNTGAGGSRFEESFRRLFTGQNPFTQQQPPTQGGAPTPSAGGGATSGGASAPSAPGGAAPGSGSAGTPGSTSLTPSVSRLSCVPSVVLTQSTSTLSWACANTAVARGQNFSTEGLLTGSVLITPTTTTQYTLRCGGDSEIIATRSCTIEVVAPKAVIVANPSRIPRGGSVNVAWVTSDTEQCSLYGAYGVVSVGERSGLVTVNNLDASTRFALVCGTRAGQPLVRTIDVFIQDETVVTQGAQVPTGTGVTTPASSYIETADTSGTVPSPSSGTFTATDSEGNTVNLCDPAIGIDRFTQCLMGQ